MRRNLLSKACSLLASLASLHAQATCELDQSVFRDAANRGFSLEFLPATGEDATVVALAELRHKTRGVIFKFEVGHSNGYGTFFLSRREGSQSQSHDLYFFDARLHEAPVNTANWVFVAGLGAADWYDTRNAPQLGNTMWKFELCRK
ncbi:MAG TPA: hypothetical protein PLL01_16185 [Rhodoferax sp.]|jgi:hypothetical protein|nr:hypothetical protein [Rhodoferax sp.]